MVPTAAALEEVRLALSMWLTVDVEGTAVVAEVEAEVGAGVALEVGGREVPTATVVPLMALGEGRARVVEGVPGEAGEPRGRVQDLGARGVEVPAVDRGRGSLELGGRHRLR